MQFSAISSVFWSLLTTALISGVLAVFSFNHRKTAKIPAFVSFLVSVAVWNLATALSRLNWPLSVVNACVVAQYSAAAAAAATGLAFALQYSGRWKQHAKVLTGLLIASPLIQFFFFITNPLHQWIWDTSVQPNLFLATPGPVFFPFETVNLILNITIAALLLHTSLTSSPIYRWQANLALAGICMALLAYSLELTFCTERPGTCQFLPVMTGITGFIWAFASYRIHAARSQETWEFDLLLNLNDGILIVNDEGVTLYSNPAFHNLFQKSSLETLGKPAAKLIPEIKEMLLRPPSAQPAIQEITWNKRHFQVHAQDLINMAREREGQFIIFADVTEQRRTEMALRMREMKYRNIVEYQNDLITVWQPDTTLSFVNEAYCRYFEKSSKEVIAHRFLQDRPPKTQAVIHDAIERLLAGEEIVTTEEFIFSKNNEKRWTQWTYLPIKENGKVLEIQSVGRDITDRKRAEQAEHTAREIAETLRIIGTELTRSLETEQILSKILDLIAPIIPFDSANFLQVKGDMAVTTRGRRYEQFGQQAVFAANNIALKIKDICNLHWMLTNKQALLVSNVQQDPNWTHTEGLNYIRSWIGAPVFVNNEIIGFFSLDGTRPDQFNEDHLRYLNVFAGQAGTALENAQLYETARLRAKEAETLQKVAMVLNTSLDQQEIFNLILEQLELVLEFDSASIILKNDDGSQLVGGRGFEDLNAILSIQFPNDNSTPTTVVLETGETFIMEDAPAQYADFRKPQYSHIRGWMGVPLTIQDRVIGLLSLDSRKPGYFNDDHARLTAAFASQVAITIENARLFQETQRLAITDPLTGCYNRRFFFDQSAREKARSNRFSRPMALIMLDLDHFKHINDRFGHRVGDQVLINLVKTIQSELRTMDILGRYGGEEFSILLPETSSEEALTVAERIRKTIEKHSMDIQENSIHITASLGVVVHTPTEKITIDELLDRADQAMYIAKRAGRNQVHLWKNTP